MTKHRIAYFFPFPPIGLTHRLVNNPTETSVQWVSIRQRASIVGMPFGNLEIHPWRFDQVETKLRVGIS